MSEKLRKFLVMAASVLVILETTVISGCHANISGTESDRMVDLKSRAHGKGDFAVTYHQYKLDFT